MSGRKNPGRAVMFSVCTNHCLGHLSLKAPPHLDHYQHREHCALRPTLLMLEVASAPACRKVGKERIYSTKTL